MELMNCLRADAHKIKGLSLVPAHILIPIFAVVLYLAYGFGRGWSEPGQLEAFYELIGMGFPLLIGIFSAVIAEQEASAGRGQNLLTLRNRMAAFFSKLVLLLILALLALLGTSLLFAGGCAKLLGNTAFGVEIYVIMAFVMWGSSIPLYVWHLYLAFVAGKGVTMGIGIVEAMASALFLTDIGKLVWPYAPFSWTARIPKTYLSYRFGQAESMTLHGNLLFLYGIVTAGSLVCYLFWAARWEGNRAAE